MTEAETPENRLKRLRMRAHRRGIKEMDLVLGRFADERLGDLNGAELDLFDQMLWENDQDLLTWVTGQAPTPVQYEQLIQRVKAHALAG